MNIKELKQQTKQRLNPNAYRLTLLHTLVALGISVAVTVISYLLTDMANTTTGLSGIGSRGLLLTAQSVLTLVVSLLMPFWNLGYTRVTLCFARREYADATDLAEGFRRFFPVLRTLFLQTALIMGIAFVCIQTATILYMFTPFSNRLMETMEPLMGPTMTEIPEITPELMERMLPALLPVYVLAGVLFLGAAVLVLYRLRLMTRSIMDKATGAFSALRTSLSVTRGHLFDFIKLDLSFWWYYLLQILAAALAYGDLLPLPIPKDIAYFLFLGLSVIAQLVITWRFAPYVQTALSLAYEQLTAADQA